MRQNSLIPTALCLLVCAGLPGCGATGKTSAFVLTLNLPEGQKLVSDIRVASVGMDPDAAMVTVQNVHRFAGLGFSVDDFLNIGQSLHDTLAAEIPAAIRSAGPRLDVHVFVRRYMVSVSSLKNAVLAGVTWAATDSSGKLIYQDQFFASEAAVTSPGYLKESVNKAIVHRIATTSLALAAGAPASKVRPTNFENTYATFEEATLRLPEPKGELFRKDSNCWHHVLIFTAFIPDERCDRLYQKPASHTWPDAKLPPDFDWQERLAKFYAICTTESGERKLAGAKFRSIMQNCDAAAKFNCLASAIKQSCDAGAKFRCLASADEKKLTAAARDSFVELCVAEAVGS